MTTPTLARPLTVLALIAAGIVGAATGAQAAPTGCSITRSYAGASTTCTAGTGEQRATAQACSAIWGCTVSQNFYGPWVGVGGTSTISLTAAWFIPGNGASSGMEARG